MPLEVPLEGKTLPFLNWPLEYCKRLGIKELTLGGIKYRLLGYRL